MTTVDQSTFRAAVLDPALPVPDGLVDPDGNDAGKRFDVYRNNVVVSLTEALAEGFPVIKQVLGEGNFAILAGHFVRAHPPTSPLMSQYGAELPTFLRGFAPVRSLPFLPDLAKLETALRQSYHAADAEPIESARLQELPEQDLLRCQMSLAPAVRLVPSDWPIVSIWRLHTENGPKPTPRAETALVTRPEFDPQVHDLTPGGAAFVQALADDLAFGDAVERGTEAEDAFDLATPLSALLSGGAIVALKEPNP